MVSTIGRRLKNEMKERDGKIRKRKRKYRTLPEEKREKKDENMMEKEKRLRWKRGHKINISVCIHEQRRNRNHRNGRGVWIQYSELLNLFKWLLSCSLSSGNLIFMRKLVRLNVYSNPNKIHLDGASSFQQGWEIPGRVVPTEEFSSARLL